MSQPQTGRVPIAESIVRRFFGGELIGAVGATGAAAADDEICVRAGLEAAGLAT